MMKLKLLLLTLITVLLAACAADTGQDKAVPTAESALTTAIETTATTGSADAGQETAVAAEREPATPEIQATKPLPTEAPAATDTPAAAVLPMLGAAPGWDNDVWINSDGPLPLEDLRGKVVLLEFWTFG